MAEVTLFAEEEKLLFKVLSKILPSKKQDLFSIP